MSASTFSIPACDLSPVTGTSPWGATLDLTKIFVGRSVRKTVDPELDAGVQSTQIEDTGDDCAAIRTCADFVAMHWSFCGNFDLHYNIQAEYWDCVTYLYWALHPAYSTIADAGVDTTNGYYGPMCQIDTNDGSCKFIDADR